MRKTNELPFKVLFAWPPVAAGKITLRILNADVKNIAYLFRNYWLKSELLSFFDTTGGLGLIVVINFKYWA